MMNTRHPRHHTRLFAASLLAGAVGMASAGIALAQQVDERALEERTDAVSEQPMGDTWITTKVKAELLATEDVSGLEISVETVNGVVHLAGNVDSQSGIDRAVAVAERIEGVTRVDSSKLTVGKAGDDDQ
jgi:hyperosmotically inducible protein